MKDKTKIFTAKKIITMNPEQPTAVAAAVKDGRILAVGELAEIIEAVKNSPFTPYEVDTSLNEKILMPGLVDAHTHLELQVPMYSGEFVSQIGWPRPEGGYYPTYDSKSDVLDRLRCLNRELPPGKLLYGASYDQDKAGGEFHVSELDAISTDRPILISATTFHRFWVNSYVLEKSGITPENVPPDLLTDPDGKPNGTAIDSKGLSVLMPGLDDLFDITEEKILRLLPLFSNTGITTLADVGFGAFDIRRMLEVFKSVFSDPMVGLRCLASPFALTGVAQVGSLEAYIKLLKEIDVDYGDQFRIGPVKLYLDGSIPARGTPIGWPGVFWDGSPEGHNQCPPEQLVEMLVALHEADFPTITHAVSRPGVDTAIDAVAEAQRTCYRPDMRHRVDHCFYMTEAQMRRAKALDMGVQLFIGPLHYYGETHQKLMGPDCARHMAPCGMARRIGVSWGMHMDPPGTPELPWVGIWTAVNRITEKGKLLGPGQRVSVEEALRVWTLGHAYQLHLDHEIGSIEFGKKADFCVLEADPLEIDPMELKDIPVWGTVFGGELNPRKTN